MAIRRLSARSQQLYQYWQGRYVEFLGGASPTVENAKAFLERMEREGKKPNTLAVAARALRHMGLDVPVSPVEMGEPSYLDVEQVRQLIKAAPSVLERTIITVLFSSACRISEVLGLTVADLELDVGVATVTRKGGRRERVNLGRQGAQALREWLAYRRSRDQRVFMDYTYHDIYMLLKRLAKRAGIATFHPHMLRHSRIMHLRKAGHDWADISEIAGHRQMETTVKIYGRRKAEERAELLEDF